MKRIYYWLGERSVFVVWLVNLIMFNVRAVGWLPSRYRDKRRSYPTEAGHIGKQPAAVDHNDLGLNFYIRLIVQYRYETVIELGAFSMERATWLAKHFPEVRVHALDVTRDFREPRIVDGVNVGPNTTARIREVATARTLVVAHGTLCCYSPKQLSELIATLRDLKIDLAFSEPNTSGELSLNRSLRRTGQSYYHPYLTMLADAGFTFPDNKGHQIRDCWSEYAETRTFLFARP